MYETPFPVTPGEMIHWEGFDMDVSDALTLLLYMEEREYIKNIGTVKKPFYVIAPFGVTMVESLEEIQNGDREIDKEIVE